jgi:hypothetical protein
VLDAIREGAGPQGETRERSDRLTMRIQIAPAVVHEKEEKEPSDLLLFSSPPRGTLQKSADIDAHTEVLSTPSPMERIMLQASNVPDYLRLKPHVASCEPLENIEGDGSLELSFGQTAFVEKYHAVCSNPSFFQHRYAGLSRLYIDYWDSLCASGDDFRIAWFSRD